MAKGAKKKEVSPKERPGAIVHAKANKVLGDKPAKNIFGNVNYCKYLLEGEVVEAVDRRKEGGKVAVIYIKAKWTVPGGAYPDGKIEEVHKNGVNHGPIPDGANPNVSVNHPDAVGDPSHSTKGSTTYIPNAEGAPNVSTTSTTTQQPAAAAAAAPVVDSNKKARTSSVDDASNPRHLQRKRRNVNRIPMHLST